MPGRRDQEISKESFLKLKVFFVFAGVEGNGDRD